MSEEKAIESPTSSSSTCDLAIPTSGATYDSGSSSIPSTPWVLLKRQPTPPNSM